MKIEGRRPEPLGGPAACSPGKVLKHKSLRNAFSCNLEKKSSCNGAYLIYYNKTEWYSVKLTLSVMPTANQDETAESMRS